MKGMYVPQGTPGRRSSGCPCGHLEPEECVTRTPLPIIEKCSNECWSWGLEEIRYYAKELGHCPCVDDELRPVEAVAW